MRARIALLVMLVAATGCTTAGTHPTRGDELPAGVTFSEVAVEIDSSLPPDRLVAFRHNRGAHLLRDAIVEALKQQGRIDPSARHRLELHVVGFRLKRGWDGILNGTLAELVAGGYTLPEDFLTVEVSVKGNHELQTGAYSVSVRGGIVFFGESGRLANLARALAKVLTTEI